METALSSEESDDEAQEDKSQRHENHPNIMRIKNSKYRSSLGRLLQQETGSLSQQVSRRTKHSSSSDWQCETSNFYSKPEDIHSYTTVHNIPFCAVGCRSMSLPRPCEANTNRATANSLVAIGDEDGGIKVVDTAFGSHPGFSKPWVSFRPHLNAILDLAFSPDDLLLATASGDQTAQIIDMPTQRTTYSMAGHFSSVKQVRFQPQSSDVVATSSRDGSVQIWDLRCKGLDGPLRHIKMPLDSSSINDASASGSLTWARPVNTIYQAHAGRQPGSMSVSTGTGKSLPTPDEPSKTEAPGRTGDVSVTALEFLQAPRSNLLLTASEANASVKLWDLRTIHRNRRSNQLAVPLSTTRQPESHTKHRNYGLTSLSLSGDGARLYTVCRDNTIYAYSTSHLILGHAPQLSSSHLVKLKRPPVKTEEKEGLGPIYGFRHAKFHATTFYVTSALRVAKEDKSEMLAVGSSDGCAVLFPTHAQYLEGSRTRQLFHERPQSSNRSRRPLLSRSDSGLSSKPFDTIPIYEHGSALVKGHSKEVTGVAWSFTGELVTLGDDGKARCWRENDKVAAKSLRTGGEGGGRRWGSGWAEVEDCWDEDDC